MATATATNEHDTNIWRALEPLSDGFVPHVKRTYIWTGSSRGENCRIVCELIKKHSEGRYYATACFAHNIWFLCRDVVRMEDLEEVK